MEMCQTEIPICIKHGSYTAIPIYYKDSDGDAIDITDYDAKCQIRQTPDSDDPADIELTVANGGIILDETNGIVYLIFFPAVTLALDSNYEGYWDCFLIPTEETAFYLAGGTIQIKPSALKV